MRVKADVLLDLLPLLFAIFVIFYLLFVCFLDMTYSLSRSKEPSGSYLRTIRVLAFPFLDRGMKLLLTFYFFPVKVTPGS